MASVPATAFVCLNRCLLDLLLNICLFHYKYHKMLIVNFKYYRSNKSVSEFWVWTIFIGATISMNAYSIRNLLNYLRWQLLCKLHWLQNNVLFIRIKVIYKNNKNLLFYRFMIKRSFLDSFLSHHISGEFVNKQNLAIPEQVIKMFRTNGYSKEWDTHFEQNLINWLQLRLSLNIYVWVGGAFGLIYYVTLRQNSLCKLIWSFFSFRATSNHRQQDFLSRPPLPTHLSMIIMLCCMLLLNCSSYLFIYFFPYSRRLVAGGGRVAMSLQLVGTHDARWTVSVFVLCVTL